MTRLLWLLLMLLPFGAGAQSVVVMTPDREPILLEANASALVHRLQLRELVAGVTYEVRVSYVATTPCAFTLRLVEPEQRSSGRALLNAEKLLFAIDRGDSAEVLIEADLSDYLSATGDGSAARSVPFLVALESTVRGVPLGVARLAGVLCAAAAVGVCAWGRAMTWLDGGRRKKNVH